MEGGDVNGIFHYKLFIDNKLKIRSNNNFNIGWKNKKA